MRLALLPLLLAPLAQEAEPLRWKFAKGDRFRLEVYRSTQVRVGPDSFRMDVGTGASFEALEVDPDGGALLQVVYDRSTAAAVGPQTLVFDSDAGARPPKHAEIQHAAGMLGHPFRLRLSPAGEIRKVEGFDAVVRAAKAAVDPDLQDKVDADPAGINENIRVNLQEWLPLFPAGDARSPWQAKRQFQSVFPVEPFARDVEASVVSTARGSALLMERHRGTAKEVDGKGALELVGRTAARWDVKAGRLLQGLAETRLSGTLLGKDVEVRITDDVRPVPAVDPAARKRILELVARARRFDDPAWGELEKIGPPARMAVRILGATEPAGSERRALAEGFLSGAAKAGSEDRLEKKRNRVAQRGGNARTEEAVLAGLKWLSRHQSPDGSWGGDASCGQVLPRKFAGRCGMGGGAASAVEQTALALLAFHGTGYSEHSLDAYDTLRFGDSVARALAFLERGQGADGAYHPTSVEAHAVATLAVLDGPAELADLGWTTLSAHRALGALRKARIPGKGWPRNAGEGPEALSTAWALLALWRAREAGLEVPAGDVAEAQAWLASVTDAKTGRIAGAEPGAPAHVAAALARAVLKAAPPEGTSALADEAGSPLAAQFAALLLLQLPQTTMEAWRSWQEKHVLAAVERRAAAPGACETGSWAGPAGGPGRIATTALNCLLLESYYRYPAAAFDPASRK